VRPPLIVYHVVKYIRDCICDQDRMPTSRSFYKYASERVERHSFLDIYSFVQDRIRQLVKDFTIVESCITDLN
jgi:hypothetical protein